MTVPATAAASGEFLRTFYNPGNTIEKVDNSQPEHTDPSVLIVLFRCNFVEGVLNIIKPVECN